MKAALLLLVSFPTLALSQEVCDPPTNFVRSCPPNFLPKPPEAGKVDPADKERINAKIRIAMAWKETYESGCLELDEARNDPTSKLTKEDLRKKEAELRDQRKRMYAAFNDALADAVQVYRLTPPQTTLTSDPRLGGTGAMSAMHPWTPRFSEREVGDQKIGWRMRNPRELLDERGKDRIERPDGSVVEGGVSASVTWQADDRISLFWTAFVKGTPQYREDDTAVINMLGEHQYSYVPDADGLAALVAHETVHWVYNVAKKGPEETATGYFEEEAIAYERQAKLLDAVGAPDDAKRARQYSTIYASQAVEAKGKTVNYIVGHYSSKWLGIEALQRRENVRANKAAIPPSENNLGEPGKPEPLKTDGDDAFLSGLGSLEPPSGDARFGFDSKKEEDTQELQNQRHKEQEAASKRRKLEWDEARRASARVCGFIEFYHYADPTVHWGFGRGKTTGDAGPKRSFYFRPDADVSDASMIAAFTLADACLDASNRYRKVPTEFCGGGLEVMQRHWSEPDFRESLALDLYLDKAELKNVASASYCVSYLIKHAAAPLDVASLRGALLSYRAQVERLWEAQAKWEREHPTTTNSSPNPVSPANHASGGGGGQGGGSQGGGGYYCPSECISCPRPNFCLRNPG